MIARLKGWRVGDCGGITVEPREFGANCYDPLSSDHSSSARSSASQFIKWDPGSYGICRRHAGLGSAGVNQQHQSVIDAQTWNDESALNDWAPPFETAPAHRINAYGLGSRSSTITSAVLAPFAPVAETTSIYSPIDKTPSLPIETHLFGCYSVNGSRSFHKRLTALRKSLRESRRACAHPI